MVNGPSGWGRKAWLAATLALLAGAPDVAFAQTIYVDSTGSWQSGDRAGLAAGSRGGASAGLTPSVRILSVAHAPGPSGGEIRVGLSRPTDVTYRMEEGGRLLVLFLADAVADATAQSRPAGSLTGWSCRPATRAPGCDLAIAFDQPVSLAGFALDRGAEGAARLRLALGGPEAEPPGRPQTGVAWAGGVGLDPSLWTGEALAALPRNPAPPEGSALASDMARQTAARSQALQPDPPLFQASASANPDAETGEVSLFDLDYWKNFGIGPWEMAKRPFATDEDSLIMNAIVLGSFGLAYIFDEDIRGDVLRDRTSSSDDVMDAFEPLGRFWWLAGAGAGSYGVGAVLGDDRLARAGLLASQAVLLTALPVEATKNGITRARPNANKGKEAWFEGGSNYSFLSGHTAYSFAFASAFAHEYADTGWVPIVAYGLAGAVGLQRIHDDKHWTSDVVVSAIVGWGVGQLVTELDPFGSQKALGLEPLQNEDAQGLSLRYRF